MKNSWLQPARLSEGSFAGYRAAMVKTWPHQGALGSHAPAQEGGDAEELAWVERPVVALKETRRLGGGRSLVDSAPSDLRELITSHTAGPVLRDRHGTVV